MAIREAELEDGKNYLFLAAHVFPNGALAARLMLVEYIYKPTNITGTRVYQFKILKNYFHMSTTNTQGWPKYNPGDTYQIYVLKPIYKENYRFMKRRFIRTILKPKSWQTD